MPDFTQENRFLKIATPLADDALLLRSFKGEEELSQPFHFSLNMLAQDPALDMSKLIGQPVTFSAKTPDDKFRVFNGKVLRIAAGEVENHEEAHRRFHAEVVPNLWFLKFSSQSRVFQNKTIPDIVEKVWTDAGLTDLKILTGAHAKLEYCVQYNESDYQFVTRLLEKAGIAYYIDHQDKKHLTVLFDKAAKYVNCDEADVEFQGTFDLPQYGEITKWERRIEITPGKYTTTDYNFETSATDLKTTEKTILKTKGIADYEVYEYPGGYTKTADGKPLATARMEELEVPGEVVIGDGSCVSFSPGGKFKLKTHPVDSECNKSYALVAVSHHAVEPTLTFGKEKEADDDRLPYTNQFRCIPAKTMFRPARVTPVPRVHGLQTAKVVGAKNNEILTDKYGRVKLQFHWDREGKFDVKSSCWVRVAQSWAGAKRGTLFTPRVGDEVVVDFLEGDPDRPLVVGSLYNDVNQVPYALPDKAAHSGIKTHSIDKGKADQFNELRFEDTTDKELIYFHAQNDFVRIVENDDKLKVGYDKKDKGDQTIEIYNDRTVTVDKGMDTLTVKTMDRTLNVDKGNHLVNIKMGNHKMHVKAGKSEVEAAQKIVFKVGGSSIEMTPTDIKIKAMNVTISGELNTKIKAGIAADLEGGAMATIKGGIVNIN